MGGEMVNGGGPRRVTCRSHCATCGRHFTSLEAFDLHRDGESTEGRGCGSPLDEQRLVTATENGYCAISGEHDDGKPLTLDPVTVWVSARQTGPEQHARFAALALRSTR
jgi:hypothetical protein